jgi:hypothetical protein
MEEMKIHPACSNCGSSKRECHICGTVTAEHSSICSAAGVPSEWDMGSTECAACKAPLGDCWVENAAGQRCCSFECMRAIS